MAVIIDDPDASRLVHELTALTGESTAEAVRRALAERLARTRSTRDEERERLFGTFAPFRIASLACRSVTLGR